MKKSSVPTTLALGGSALLTLFLCGCGPELAQVEYGSEEAGWSKAIENSYPGYRNPRTAPPAIVDNVSPRLIEAEEVKAEASAAENDIVVEENAIPAPAEDAVQTEVKQADKQAENKEAAQTENPEKIEKPAETSATPAADSADAVTSTVYEVKAGDTLSGIAKKHYGDAAKYDIIIKANSIKDPKRIRVGTKLLIPQL